MAKIRRMTRDDIPLGMRLKELAGWNQQPADWEGFLCLEPEGCLVAERQGQAVATATAFHYEDRFGWIGMVLVDPAARRQGIATSLVQTEIEFLERLGCSCQKLDATEAGSRVYERMGFRIEYAVQRWEGRGQVLSRHKGLTRVSPEQIESLNRLDREAFGASRLDLLRWYGRPEGIGLLASDPSQPRGYVTGRLGSRSRQIGPLVAQNPQTAELLLRSFLSLYPDQPIIADLPVPNREAADLLRRYHFHPHRLLFRMYRGPNRHPGRLERIYLLAGFEFG